jgi:hypothetical protein
MSNDASATPTTSDSSKASVGQTLMGMVILAVLALVVLIAWRGCTGTSVISAEYITKDYLDGGYTQTSTASVITTGGNPVQYLGAPVRAITFERRRPQGNQLIERHRVLVADHEGRARTIGISYMAVPGNATDEVPVKAPGALTFFTLALGGSDVGVLNTMRSEIIGRYNATKDPEARARGVVDERTVGSFRVRMHASDVVVIGPCVDISMLPAEIVDVVGWDKLAYQ